MRLCVFLSVLALASGSTLRVHADARDGSHERGAAESDAPAGYDERVKRALEEFELANYAEARSLLQQAHELYPNARTSRALGMVEFELKNYASCISRLEQALHSTRRPLTAEQSGEAERLLARAYDYIGRYAVTLRPGSATLLVDGQPAQLDARGVLVLGVGDHLLEASAQGHRTLRRELSVAGGRSENLDLVLLPVAASETASGGVRPASASTPVYKKWWLWTTIGVVVAAGAVTGILLATREPEPRAPNGGSLNETVRLLSWR